MIRAFQWDLARQVERLDVLLDLLPRYAAWGYQELYLHLEDAVDYPGLPGIARADAYRWSEFAQLVSAATRVGIGVVPIVNLLGHTQYLVQHPDLRDLNELRQADGSPQPRGQICPLHPRTLEIAEKLLRDVAPFCTTGKVHVGLDESFLLGRHPLSRAEIARIGLAAHFAAHATRLEAITRSLGLRLGLWADMLALLPAAIPLLPRGIAAYDWYYHPFHRLPRVELHNFREYDLAPALHRQGIGYWGCPMNGAFRFEPLPVFGERLANLQAWWRRCRQTGAEGFLVTSWESYRLALELTTVVDAAAASLWLEPEITDHTTLLARGFERVFGCGDTRRWARAALQCDERAFAGYARWETNHRWDVRAGHDDLAHSAAEARFFNRLAARALPAPFAASVAFRLYLARREVLIRDGARAVFKLRRLLAAGRAAEFEKLLARLIADAARFSLELKAGRAAAEAMWRRTRRAPQPSQNREFLRADAARLRRWQGWLRSCARRPAHARRAGPLAGAWQLVFQVHNFAPALQKIVVEERSAQGHWREIHSRFTIEFRAAGARPHSRLKHPFSAPVSGPKFPLRIGVRGTGEIAISQLILTDGVRQFAAAEFPRRARLRLGTPAPAEGLPALDWQANLGAEFRPVWTPL